MHQIMYAHKFKVCHSDTNINFNDNAIPVKHGRKWFIPFWEACLARVRYNSLPALLRVNKDGWLDPESQCLVASRVIAHRLKEIGDVVEDNIDPELVPKKMDPVQIMDVVADATYSE